MYRYLPSPTLRHLTNDQLPVSPSFIEFFHLFVLCAGTDRVPSVVLFSRINHVTNFGKVMITTTKL